MITVQISTLSFRNANSSQIQPQSENNARSSSVPSRNSGIKCQIKPGCTLFTFSFTIHLLKYSRHCRLQHT